jgi:thioredoxin-related protein
MISIVGSLVNYENEVKERLKTQNSDLFQNIEVKFITPSGVAVVFVKDSHSLAKLAGYVYPNVWCSCLIWCNLNKTRYMK